MLWNLWMFYPWSVVNPNAPLISWSPSYLAFEPNLLPQTFEQLRGLHDFPIASSPRCTGMGINGPAQLASQFVCHKNMLGVFKSWPVPTWVCPLMTPNCHMFMCKMMTHTDKPFNLWGTNGYRVALSVASLMYWNTMTSDVKDKSDAK